MAAPTARVHLYLHGERRFTIEVPESITTLDLRRRASQYFKGRVRTMPEEFPPNDDAIVHCIPSFVADTGPSDEADHTVVP